jgi:hypothetical protein
MNQETMLRQRYDRLMHEVGDVDLIAPRRQNLSTPPAISEHRGTVKIAGISLTAEQAGEVLIQLADATDAAIRSRRCGIYPVAGALPLRVREVREAMTADLDTIYELASQRSIAASRPG